MIHDCSNQQPLGGGEGVCHQRSSHIKWFSRVLGGSNQEPGVPGQVQSKHLNKRAILTQNKILDSVVGLRHPHPLKVVDYYSHVSNKGADADILKTTVKFNRSVKNII